MREPDSFGRTEGGTFFSYDESPRQLAMARAAQFHHRWAYRTRQALKEQRWKGLNQQEFARRAGMSDQRFSRLLNGSIVLRLEDIAACEEVLGSGAYLEVLRQGKRHSPQESAEASASGLVGHDVFA